MIRNYLTTALRNFNKNRFYVAVNILGLSIGITSCLVVYTILRHELRFDAFHEKSDEIYRVVEHYQGDYEMEYTGRLANAMPGELADPVNFGKDAIPMLGPISATIEFNHYNQHKAFKEEYVVFANSHFFEHLDFEILQGSDASIMDEPGKVFLTKSLAKKYFADDNAIGQFLTFEEDNQLEVVGILADPPTNTNVPFDLIISYSSREGIYGNFASSWEAYWMGSAYVRVSANEDLRALEKRITQILYSHRAEEEQIRYSYHLQPLAEVHTDRVYEDSVNYVAPSEVIVGFVLLAVITLLASILNFVNLSTAQAVKRSKEVGIRKTLGSSKMSLAFQFIGETLILVFIATLLAFTAGQFFISKLNNLLSLVRFEISYDLSVIMFSIVLTLLVGLIAGFYPAIVISGYNPTAALKNQISLKKGTGKSFIRKGLVITQFVVANLLIITTVIVSAQMSFIKTKDLGFDKDNILVLDFPEQLSEKMPTILSEFRNQSFVKDATWCQGAPQSGENWGSNYSIEGRPSNDRMNMAVKFVDERYLDVFQIPLLSGRNIVNRAAPDTTKQLLVNREFLKRADLKMEEALGKEVTFFGNWKGEIIGIIENHHVYSLQDEIYPVMLTYNPSQMTQLNLKLDHNNGGTTFANVERIFRSFAPTAYFDAKLLNDIINESYVVENLVYTAFQVFAVLAVLIGIFGLYGLVSFMASSNIKSISIRKVFGASFTGILGRFSSEYLIMMAIAFAVASPIAYLVCREWLNGFQYQITISVGYFLLGLGISMVITVVTIGRKSLLVAHSNPINSLRYE